MSRGNSMSGANNIPLGSRSGFKEGTLAQAAATLSGTSLLNPEYLQQAGGPSSGSRFGPAVNIGPPAVVSASNGFGTEGPKRLPNMDLIASINATLAKKSSEDGNPLPQNENSNDSSSERKRKRKSRWGADDLSEKLFIPGLPTVIPPGLSKDQEEAYLLQLRIEDATRRLRTGDLGIPPNPEDRSPSPEPIYSSEGKRMNTREYRKRRELEEQRHEAIQEMLKINPDYKAPQDYRAPQIKVTDKVFIPQEEHPEINFVGLLIGPRGNTLKSMEKDTGAKIIIRGKGSVKEGKVGLKYGHPMPGEDEPLHAYITGNTAESVRKAVERIKQVIKEGIDVPEGQSDLRKHQLRELALLNGTLRDGDVPRCSNCGAADHKSWQCQDRPNITNNVICSSCGGAGHIAKDCVARRPGTGFGGDFGPPKAKQNRIDEEYMSLMAELGEGPPPPAAKEDGDSKPAWQQARSGSGMFNRPSAPRALGGPSEGGPRGPPNRDSSGANQSDGWNSSQYGYYGGNRPPRPMDPSSNRHWGQNDNRRGGQGWNRGQGPPTGGQGGAPPHGGPPGHWNAQGYPSPYLNAPPPPGGASGGNAWGWAAGPVPPPPPPSAGGPPSYWGSTPGSWQPNPSPPNGAPSAPGINLSSLIAPPPPPPK